MHTLITRRDLRPLDLVVLRDLVRFGVLANDQIDRRYGDQSLATARLSLLVDSGFVDQWSSLLQETSIYSATAVGAGAAKTGLRPTRPSLEHLRHDVAVVDLADYLLCHQPGADWRTEREVGRELRGDRPTHAWGQPRGSGHRPDGLLLIDGKRLAVELEHSNKGDQRYARICRWFAGNVSIDGVRWYVDDPKIIDRIERVNRQHGFEADIDTAIEPFPPGVVVRPWVRPRTRGVRP